MPTSSTVIKMNWVAILVFLAAVIYDCSARNNLTIEDILKEPCDDEMPNETFNLVGLLDRKQKNTPMFIALRDLREKLPPDVSRDNPKNLSRKFKTVKEKELKKAFKQMKKMKYAERGLKAIQIMLYKFYIKLDKILSITEDKLEQDTEIKEKLLSLLCVFVQTGVRPTDGVLETLLTKKRNVKADEIVLHRYTFKQEISNFLCLFKNSLSKLVRKAKKNKNKKGKNIGKQNKRRRRERNKRKNKKNIKKFKSVKKIRQNSCTRVGKLLRKGQQI